MSGPLAYDGNEFGDAIRAACRRAAEAIEPPEYHVLATPEMQALRLVARHSLADWCCDECRNAYADEHQIPRSVIEWVLS